MVTKRAQVGDDICVCGIARREHWNDTAGVNGCAGFVFDADMTAHEAFWAPVDEHDIEVLWRGLGKALSLINPKEFRTAADQQTLFEAQQAYAQWKEVK